MIVRVQTNPSTSSYPGRGGDEICYLKSTLCSGRQVKLLFMRVQFIVQVQAPSAGSVPPPPREKQHAASAVSCCPRPSRSGCLAAPTQHPAFRVSILVELAFCWSGFICRYLSLLSTLGSLCAIQIFSFCRSQVAANVKNVKVLLEGPNSSPVQQGHLSLDTVPLAAC